MCGRRGDLCVLPNISWPIDHPGLWIRTLKPSSSLAAYWVFEHCPYIYTLCPLGHPFHNSLKVYKGWAPWPRRSLLPREEPAPLWHLKGYTSVLLCLPRGWEQWGETHKWQWSNACAADGLIRLHLELIKSGVTRKKERPRPYHSRSKNQTEEKWRLW